MEIRQFYKTYVRTVVHFLMKYTAKGTNTSYMLVKLKAIQIQSHYDKVK